MAWRYIRNSIMIKQYSLRKIYEYASEHRKSFAFSHSKTAISFNILLVIIYTYDTLSQKHIFSGLKLHLHNDITINAVYFLYLFYLWYGTMYKRQYTPAKH